MAADRSGRRGGRSDGGGPPCSRAVRRAISPSPPLSSAGAAPTAPRRPRDRGARIHWATAFMGHLPTRSRRVRDMGRSHSGSPPPAATNGHDHPAGQITTCIIKFTARPDGARERISLVRRNGVRFCFARPTSDASVPCARCGVSHAPAAVVARRFRTAGRPVESARSAPRQAASAGKPDGSAFSISARPERVPSKPAGF